MSSSNWADVIALTVAALTGHGNIELLAEQAQTFGAELAVTADEGVTRT